MSSPNVTKRTERVISSEKIKPTKRNILKDNPISKRISKIGGAIKAIPVGILFLLIGLYLTYTSVVKVKEVSKIVEPLAVVSADSVDKDYKLAIFTGKAQTKNPSELEYLVCESYYSCDDKDEYAVKKTDNLLFVSAEYQRYEQKERIREEERTRIENGVEIKDTIEIKETIEEWVTISNITNFYPFNIGTISVDTPEKADRYINLQEQTIEDIYIANAPVLNYVSKEDASDQVGKTRLLLKTLPSEVNLSVVGEVQNQSLTGDVQIITDMQKDSLVETLRNREKAARTTYRFMAWLCLTIGIMTVLGPILSIIEIIPVIGKSASFVAFIIGAIISAIVVFVGVILIKFWWIFLILMLLLMGGAGYLFFMWIKSRQTSKE